MSTTPKNTAIDPDEAKCVICGRRESESTKSDFLRECYEMGQDGKWDKGMFQPRLNFVEIAFIKRGFNYVCHNRSRCRERQAKNARMKRKQELDSKTDAK